MDKIVYYPGCIAESASQQIHAVTEKVLGLLDIPYEVLPELTCCGSVNVRDRSPLTHLALNARNFALCASRSLPIVTICGTCLYSMSAANAQLRAEPDTLSRINALLNASNLTYDGNVVLKHLVWLLLEDYGVERLRAKVKKRLTLTIAAFHGCHTLRPAAVLGRDPDELAGLPRLLEALGARVTDFASAADCCGYHVWATTPAETEGMVGAVTNDAAARGADMLVTSSTLCQLALDRCQGKSRAFAHANLPVLHLVQVLGLALGLSPESLGLHRHGVLATKALRKLFGKTGAPAVAKRFDLLEPDDPEPEVPLPTPRPSLIQIRRQASPSDR